MLDMSNLSDKNKKLRLQVARNQINVQFSVPFRYRIQDSLSQQSFIDCIKTQRRISRLFPAERMATPFRAIYFYNRIIANKNFLMPDTSNMPYKNKKLELQFSRYQSNKRFCVPCRYRPLFQYSFIDCVNEGRFSFSFSIYYARGAGMLAIDSMR